MQSNPLVTIILPCYNQPLLLKRCLKSIAKQIYTHTEIILVDDLSTISYGDILEEFKTLKIVRIVNKKNLGAVPNMVRCIHLPVNGLYKIVFHEDDVMHPNLLEKLVKAFQQNKNLAWAGCCMSFFKKEEEIKFEFKNIQPQYFKENIKDLVRIVVGGKTLSLASILYNCDYVKFANFDLIKYSMLGDRQMLFELGKKFGCAFIEDDLVAAYNHSDGDIRWNGLLKIHIANYYTYVKKYFSEIEYNSKYIQSGITRSLIENCSLLPNRKGIYFFYINCYFRQLISFKYFLLTNKTIKNIVFKLNKK